MIWEDCYVQALISLGFEQGLSSPYSFFHKAWGVSVVVHGDDFTALGTDEALDKYEKGLATHFELKIKGRPGDDPDDCKEKRVLNRIVRIDSNGLHYEADPRHVELLAKSLGLEECKTVVTPGVKRPFEDDTMNLVLNDDMSTTSLAAVAKQTKKAGVETQVC